MSARYVRRRSTRGRALPRAAAGFAMRWRRPPSRKRITSPGARLASASSAGAPACSIRCGTRARSRSARLPAWRETERQVEEHLEGHLARLSPQDQKTQRIVAAMRDDERKHRMSAVSMGAEELPAPLKAAMRCAAKVMTTLAYRV